MCPWLSSSYVPFGGVRGGSYLQNNSGNIYQILLSRYFTEELKQKIWGKACPGRAHRVPLVHTRSVENLKFMNQMMRFYFSFDVHTRVMYEEKNPCLSKFKRRL